MFTMFGNELREALPPIYLPGQVLARHLLRRRGGFNQFGAKAKHIQPHMDIETDSRAQLVT